MSVALVYVRQSRHKDYERTASPQVQRQACADLAAVKACDSIEFFEDLDVSGGKTTKRVNLARMLARLEAARKDDHDVAVVSAYDQSRTFRNTADALAFFALMERRPWIQVAFVQGQCDRSPAGEFTYTAMAAAHAMERRMTAEKIRAAYAFRNAQGAPTGPVPAGYKRIGTRADGEVVIDEATAPLIRRVFSDYSSGAWSTRALAHRLNAEGAIMGGSKGWFGDTVAQVLGNVAYSGRTYSISRRRRQGDLITAQWPALIERETFEAVQRQLRRNLRLLRPRLHAPREFTFAGLLVCADCGRRLRANSDHERTYYRCRGVDAPDRCTPKWARERDLLPWADELFRRLDAYRPASYAAAVEAGSEAPKPDALEQVERTIERVAKRFEWGHTDETEYPAEHDRLQRIRAELAATAREESTPPIALEGIHDAWQLASPARRRQMLTALFDGLHVRDGQLTGHYTPRVDQAARVAALLSRIGGTRRKRSGRDSARRKPRPGDAARLSVPASRPGLTPSSSSSGWSRAPRLVRLDDALDSGALVLLALGSIPVAGGRVVFATQ
jgi:DNA invertase Pin-like site-specific DNA recombinase